MAIQEYEGEAYQGAAVDDRPPLRSPGAPAFRLMVHPEQWEFIPEVGWLPHIKRMSLAPGVNGVAHAGRGGDTAARAQYIDQGFQILRYTDTEDGRSYMSKVSRTTSGQPLHHDRWHSFKQIGNSVMPVRDRDGYNAWRKWLVESKTIEAPDPDVLRAILSRKADNIRRTQAMQHIPEMKAKRAANQKTLDAASKAIK